MKKITQFLILSATLIFGLNSCLKPTAEPATDQNDSIEASSTAQTGNSGSLSRYATIGNYMYFVDLSKINVYDVSNPSSPQLLSVTEVNTNTLETIQYNDNYLYIGSNVGMYIYDVTDKSNPEYRSMAEHQVACDPVVTDGDYAYVTIRSGNQCGFWGAGVNILEVYDVSSASDPILLTTLNMTHPEGMALLGDLLIVCDRSLKLYDVSNPSNPILVNIYSSNAHDLVVDGGNVIAVTSNGIEQYSVDVENKELNNRQDVVIYGQN